MSFTKMRTIHRCPDCGVQVSKRGCRCSRCHGRRVGQLRTPEERRRIGRIAATAAAAARSALKGIKSPRSATSRYL